MHHKLKILPEYVQDIFEEKKKFEVRINDRNYQVDDTFEYITVPEFDNDERYDLLPHGQVFIIIYIHTGIGMQEGYVVFGAEPVY